MSSRRDNYPPEYDMQDDSEWTGARLRDIADHIGIVPAAEALRCIDKYGDDGATVSLVLPNGERYIVPDDLHKIRKLHEDEPVRAWIIHGIAWDGSDWEYGAEVATVGEIDAARQGFADALEEHLMLMQEWNIEEASDE